MICQLCHGTGKKNDSYFPCDRCGGSAIDHCCDGDVCQSEAEEPLPVDLSEHKIIDITDYRTASIAMPSSDPDPCI